MALPLSPIILRKPGAEGLELPSSSPEGIPKVLGKRRPESEWLRDSRRRRLTPNLGNQSAHDYGLADISRGSLWNGRSGVEPTCSMMLPCPLLGPWDPVRLSAILEVPLLRSPLDFWPRRHSDEDGRLSSAL